MSIFSITSLHSLRASRKTDPIADLKGTGHERMSRTPIFIGATIAALVMYIKSAHAAVFPDGHGPLRQQPDSEAEQPAHDETGPPASAHVTDTSLPPSRRMLPAAQDLPSDVPRLLPVGQWGWEVGGNSQSHSGFSAGASGAMRRFRLPGGVANDNGGPRAANPHSQAMKSARSNATPDNANVKPNRAPTTSGPVLLEGGFSAMAVLFTLDELLQGATDADKDTLHVINVDASSGVIIPVDDGYMYIGDTIGPVTLTYDITDGKTVVPQQASFTVSEHAATLGTNLADNIVGNDSGQLIYSGAGNDAIYAGAAIDTIYSGDGNDEVHGGAGNDVIIGGAGDDRIFGDAGNDLLFAGNGNDEVHGGDGSDRVYGGAGNDIIFGDAGNDLLFGESGNDTLTDGAGEDRVEGGDGNDTVVAAADGAADTFDGAAGADTMSYAASARAVHIDIASGKAHGADIGADTVQNFETYVGGQGNDTFVTGSQSVTLCGGEGEDVFTITVAGIDATNPVRHVIEDFEIGDHVRMSVYDIFEEADAAPDFLDQMKVGNGEAPDSAVPIQFRTDDELHKTFIEADFDHDGVYEASVELDGHHVLQLQQMSLV